MEKLESVVSFNKNPTLIPIIIPILTSYRKILVNFAAVQTEPEIIKLLFIWPLEFIKS
jgi:hypothetical protein